jgi:hypothetical protein
MAGQFLTKSRHGSIYYFRRRVPQAAQQLIGRRVLVQSLETSDRRAAVIRSRALATQTDAIFQRIAMTTKSTASDGFTFNYEMKLDFNELGMPLSLHVKAEPEEQEAVNSAIRAALQGARERGSTDSAPCPQKPFSDAIPEYFSKSQTKAQTKATYRSKLDHAKKFFGDSKCVLQIDQADFVGYCDHVLTTIPNATSQGHYMTTVATFLNWYRVRSAGLPALTTKTLVPKRDSPESEDRAAFTPEQLGLVFENATQYRRSNPHKFWASIAPAFLGCRIEELCQIHLKTDLVNDEEAGVWYLIFDGRPNPDGVVRKSMKKVSSWRHVPIHASLIQHGFIEFLRSQQQAGFQRPFQKEWKPREVASALGQIIKWSHYVSGWGGRELNAIAARHGFDPERLAYFHSMRHTFKSTLGDAGVSSEISEALSGRRYAGADAERYEKLKQNHRRLSADGIARGLDALAALLDKTLNLHPRSAGPTRGIELQV